MDVVPIVSNVWRDFVCCFPCLSGVQFSWLFMFFFKIVVQWWSKQRWLESLNSWNTVCINCIIVHVAVQFSKPFEIQKHICSKNEKVYQHQKKTLSWAFNKNPFRDSRGTRNILGQSLKTCLIEFLTTSFSPRNWSLSALGARRTVDVHVQLPRPPNMWWSPSCQKVSWVAFVRGTNRDTNRNWRKTMMPTKNKHRISGQSPLKKNCLI